MITATTYRILSIDAWGNKKDGYDWNQWFDVGCIFASKCENTRAMLHELRRRGFLTPQSAGKVSVEDDQYNLVIVDRNTREPLLAIEYGVQA